MYQRTIQDIEAKAGKVKRRFLLHITFRRIAFRWGAAVGVVGGVIVDLTVRMPDPQKQPGAFLFLIVSAPIGYALLLGFLFAAIAILIESFCKAAAFMMDGAKRLFQSPDIADDTRVE